MEHTSPIRQLITLLESYNTPSFTKGDKVKHREQPKLGSGVVVGDPEGNEYPVKFGNDPEVYYTPADMLNPDNNVQNEGSISDQNVQLQQFARLLSKWSDKIDGLSVSAKPDGVWAKMLAEHGVDATLLNGIFHDSQELLESLHSVIMQLTIDDSQL